MTPTKPTGITTRYILIQLLQLDANFIRMMTLKYLSPWIMTSFVFRPSASFLGADYDFFLLLFFSLMDEGYDPGNTALDCGSLILYTGRRIEREEK